MILTWVATDLLSSAAFAYLWQHHVRLRLLGLGVHLELEQLGAHVDGALLKEHRVEHLVIHMLREEGLRGWREDRGGGWQRGKREGGRGGVVGNGDSSLEHRVHSCENDNS